MILVVGGTGALGLEICRRLRARDKPVRAIVRPVSDRARVAALEECGVELTTGDLTDADSLVTACQGADTVISAATAVFPHAAGDSIATVDRDGQVALIDAASEADVRHVVCISCSSRIRAEPPLVAAKRTVERHLRASGLTYSILRPGLFMEVWLGPASGFDLRSGTVRVAGSGEQPVSWIALGDVAEFAAHCAGDPLAYDTTIELGGPQALSPLEVVRIAEDIGGRPVVVELVPVEALRRQRAGAATPTEESFADLMLHMAQGDAVDMSATLERFPVRLTPVRDYIRRVLAA